MIVFMMVNILNFFWFTGTATDKKVIIIVAVALLVAVIAVIAALLVRYKKSSWKTIIRGTLIHGKIVDFLTTFFCIIPSI